MGSFKQTWLEMGAKGGNESPSLEKKGHTKKKPSIVAHLIDKTTFEKLNIIFFLGLFGFKTISFHKRASISLCPTLDLSNLSHLSTVPHRFLRHPPNAFLVFLEVVFLQNFALLLHK